MKGGSPYGYPAARRRSPSGSSYYSEDEGAPRSGAYVGRQTASTPEDTDGNAWAKPPERQSYRTSPYDPYSAPRDDLRVERYDPYNTKSSHSSGCGGYPAPSGKGAYAAYGAPAGYDGRAPPGYPPPGQPPPGYPPPSSAYYNQPGYGGKGYGGDEPPRSGYYGGAYPGYYGSPHGPPPGYPPPPPGYRSYPPPPAAYTGYPSYPGGPRSYSPPRGGGRGARSRSRQQKRGNNNKKRGKGGGGGGGGRKKDDSANVEDARPTGPKPDLNLEVVLRDVKKYAREKAGSHFLQCTLEEPNEEAIDQIFAAVLPELSELALDQFGNYLLSKMMEKATSLNSFTISGAEGAAVAINGAWLCNGEAEKNKKVKYKQASGNGIMIWEEKAKGTAGKAKWTIKLDGNHQYYNEWDRAYPPCTGWMSHSGTATGEISLKYQQDQANVLRSDALFGSLQGHVVKLAQDKFGCRTVQKAVEVMGSECQMKIARELRSEVMTCIKSMHGNHVIQVCVKELPMDQLDFIIQAVGEQVEFMATHQYGCRIVQRLLERCPADHIEPIIEQIVKSAAKLSRDNHGNYVMQCILWEGRLEDKFRIIKVIAEHVVDYARNKCSSNVVECCLAVASSSGSLRYELEEGRQALINAVVNQESDLRQLVDDKFGNFVVQRMLEHSSGTERDRLVEQLQADVSYLRSSANGKHILTKLEEMT